MSEKLGDLDGNIPERLKRMITIGIASVAPFISGCDNKKDHTSENPHPSNTPAAEVHLEEISKVEFTEFWEKHLTEIRMLLEKGQCKYPEINERYNKLVQETKERYGKELGIIIAINYNPLSKDVMAGSIVEESGPKLGFFVPALRDIYERKKKDPYPGWEEEFQNMTLVAGLHELDHLASGYVMNPKDQDASFEGRIRREKQAWARTCEYTIDPMIKKGVKIEESDMLRYEAWIKSGRNVDSPIWDKAMRDIHQMIK